MWINDALLKISPQKTYSRRELFHIFQNENKDLADSTFRWLLYNLQREGKLFRTGYDAYTVKPASVHPVYRPLYSKKAKAVGSMLAETFPGLKFVIFESMALNEFLNHQIACDTLYIQAEKEVSSYIFDRIREQYGGSVLYKPSAKELERYWSADLMIVLDLTSQAPLSPENPHEMTAEKLLVDVIAERSIAGSFSPAEVPYIYEGLLRNYKVDLHRMNRYAGRRGKSEEVKKYTGGAA